MKRVMSRLWSWFQVVYGICILFMIGNGMSEDDGEVFVVCCVV